MLLKAKTKLEVGKTVLFFEKLSKTELEFIQENPFQYYYPHEHDGNFKAFGQMRRNKVKATEILIKPDGYYVTVDLDINDLSTTNRRV